VIEIGMEEEENPVEDFPEEDDEEIPGISPFKVIIIPGFTLRTITVFSLS